MPEYDGFVTPGPYFGAKADQHEKRRLRRQQLAEVLAKRLGDQSKPPEIGERSKYAVEIEHEGKKLRREVIVGIDQQSSGRWHDKDEIVVAIGDVLLGANCRRRFFRESPKKGLDVDRIVAAIKARALEEYLYHKAQGEEYARKQWVAKERANKRERMAQFIGSVHSPPYVTADFEFGDYSLNVRGLTEDEAKAVVNLVAQLRKERGD